MEGKGPLRTQNAEGPEPRAATRLDLETGQGSHLLDSENQQQPRKNKYTANTQAGQAGLCSGHAIYPSPFYLSTLKRLY